MNTNNKKTKILVTGAAGTVGFETIKHLIQNPNNEVAAFDMATPKAKKKLSALGDKVKTYYGDITNQSDVLEAVKNQDVVIHLAAIIPPLADENVALANKVNIGGTQNVIELLEAYAPNCFLLFSSSISVYGDRILTPNILVTDTLNASDGDNYGQSKIVCEAMIQKSTLNWSIFRLSAIMGNHKISKLMFYMPLNTQLEICTPSDAGRAFANAVAHQSALNHQIFNLGGGANCRLSYQDFLEKTFSIYGLGAVNFPKRAFADKNYHCGFLADGDVLDNILHFRKDDLNAYFKGVDAQVSAFQKLTISLVNPFVKNWLLSQSEPYNAFKQKDMSKMKHFFWVKNNADAKHSYAEVG